MKLITRKSAINLKTILDQLQPFLTLQSITLSYAPAGALRLACPEWTPNADEEGIEGLRTDALP
jgi:hypothetical protein